MGAKRWKESWRCRLQNRITLINYFISHTVSAQIQEKQKVILTEAAYLPTREQEVTVSQPDICSCR